MPYAGGEKAGGVASAPTPVLPTTSTTTTNPILTQSEAAAPKVLETIKVNFKRLQIFNLFTLFTIQLKEFPTVENAERLGASAGSTVAGSPKPCSAGDRYSNQILYLSCDNSDRISRYFITGFGENTCDVINLSP